jgi:hypothetical protein
MERGRRSGGIEMLEQKDGLAGRGRVDLDPPPAERLERLRIGFQPPVRAGADHEPSGQLIENLVEVLEDEPVSLAAPPAGHDAAGEHDHVPAVHLTVDEHPAELVALDSGHAPRVAPLSVVQLFERVAGE